MLFFAVIELIFKVKNILNAIENFNKSLMLFQNLCFRYLRQTFYVIKGFFRLRIWQNLGKVQKLKPNFIRNIQKILKHHDSLHFDQRLLTLKQIYYEKMLKNKQMAISLDSNIILRSKFIKKIFKSVEQNMSQAQLAIRQFPSFVKKSSSPQNATMSLKGNFFLSSSKEKFCALLTGKNLYLSSSFLGSYKIGLTFDIRFTVSENHLILSSEKDGSLYLKFQSNQYAQWSQELSQRLCEKVDELPYRNIKRISARNHCAIYLCECERPQKKIRELYAIKKFRKTSLVQGKELENLKNQIEIMRDLKHPNICKLSRVYQDERSYSICMPHYSGGTLLDKCIKGNMSFGQIQEIMHQIFSGLQYIHSKDYMHRDIKPQNILLKNQESNDIAIIDFGLAAKLSKTDQRYVKCGTPGYVAPEMFKCSQSNPYDEKIDIFSTGILFYIMLTKSIPYSAKNEDQLKKQNYYFTFNPQDPLLKTFSSETLNLLEKVLERNPKNRISAKQALKHPFFSKISHSCSKQILSSSKYNLEEQKLNF